MWLTDPTKLCRKHMLGEHVETHMFLGAIKKNGSLAGYITKGLFQLEKLRERHDALAAEMARRGYKHQSPLDEMPAAAEQWAGQGQIDVAGNEIELQRRCEECRKLWETKK